jgi:hypothetical protein
VLATVAMARHALLLSGQPQLDKALALDPGAALVSEAARVPGADPDFIEADRSRDYSNCVLRYERTRPLLPGD